LNSYNDLTGSTLLQSTTSKTAPNFTDLGSGFYSISVLDDMNCSFESSIVEIIDPTEISGQLLTTVSLGCQTNAEIQLTATGGTGPYSWSIDGITFNAMNDTHVFQNVTAGTYQYFVQDSYNCISALTNEITINAVEDLTLDIDTSAAMVNCNGESTALIAATADGGLGDYQYGLFSDAALTNEIRPYTSSGTFADLPQGTYYVSVQSKDCQLTSQMIPINEPAALEVIHTKADISCNGGDDGSVVIDVTGGSGNYQFAISPNLNQFDDGNTFEDLAAGNYSVIAQDSNGCFELIEFEIIEPEALTIDLSASPEICAGDEDGSITINLTGGTAPYRTAINSNSDEDFVAGRLTFENLAAGDHLIFVRDANGCMINDVITVEAGANINAIVEVIYECASDTPENRLAITLEDASVVADILYGLNTDDPANMVMEPNFENVVPGAHFITIAHANGCINTIDFEVEAFEPLQLSLEQNNLNEITAIATGGKEGYTFYFNDENNGEDNTFYIRRTDTYTVRVVDENGCESVGTIFMEFIDIEIPNFFTPDGDGANDFWIPKNIAQFPDIFIKIYDRYGREVYQIRDDAQGWDGLYQDTDLPSGDYWYIIKLNGEEDEREFVGHFTLYR